MPAPKEVKEGRMWYQEVYLQSKHWKRTAATFKEQRGYKCDKCGRHTTNLDVHHNGLRSGYYDERGRTLLGRELECPHLMQVLCRDCHDKCHPDRCRLGKENELPEWITPEEVKVAEQAARFWSGESEPDRDDPIHQMAWSLVVREELYNLGLDPDDPDFNELAAEGLEGNEDGNYDDERDNRIGDNDPVYLDGGQDLDSGT